MGKTPLAAFARSRWRTEIIAIAALAIGALAGIVSADSIFSGFSDPAVITVIEILMLAQLIARSGLVDHYARPVLAALSTEAQLTMLRVASGVEDIVRTRINDYRGKLSA